MHIHIARIVGIQIITTIYIYILYQLHTLWQFLPTQYQHFPPELNATNQKASRPKKHPPKRDSSRIPPRNHQNENPNPIVNHTLPRSFALPEIIGVFFSKFLVGGGGMLKYHRNSLVLFCFVWWGENSCGLLDVIMLLAFNLNLVRFLSHGVHGWFFYSNHKWWPGMKVRFLVEFLPL